MAWNRRAVVGLVGAITMLAWAFAATPAFADTVPPVTVPVITAPADTATVLGDVPVTATSDAPFVQFSLDAAPYGAPVAVATGTASTSWSSWAAANGAHTWTAADCNDIGCNVTQSSPVGVTLANTVPVITAPADTATVAGDVPVTATSDAPFVQFSLDAAPYGAPVAVATGTASTSWSSWGTANGAHTWTAAACDNVACNATQSSPVGVTLTNTDPAITAPTDGATTSTSLTLQADAPGGGLAFFLDGVEVGFAGAAPYSVDSPGPLVPGDHTASVQECDAAESQCAGPVSPTVTFTVQVLQPQITSVAPNPFSPHHDGRDDTTLFHLHLPEAEHVSFTIRNGNNTVIAGPHTPGTIAAGDHTITWDGKNNSGKIAGDGTYSLVVDTTATVNGADLQGTATRTVRVDDSPTSFSGVTGNGFTFYPVIDGYRDTFGPKVTVSEGGGLWLEIYNAAGSKVREIAHPHASGGTMQFHWDGRTAGGQLLKAGTYRYFFKAQDRAGNRSSSPNYSVSLRHEHLVNKTATLHHDGRDGVLGTTDLSCTDASYGLSAFPHGVWLDNVCARSAGDQVIAASYNFSAPGAVQYNNLRLRSYGNTIDAPEAIAAIVFNWSTRNYDTIGGALVSHNGVNAWTNFGTVSTTNRVSSSRAVKVVIGVPNLTPPEDYDIGLVELTVSYSVLHA